MKRVAIVGTAHIHTPGFVNMLKERPDIEVAAIWDYDMDRAKKFAAEFNCPVRDNAEDIWRDSSIDAAIITSETNLHRSLVCDAARAGKHLFVEKPLGFAAEDAREMACAIRKAGVLFQTGYFMRGSAPHRTLKKLIDGGVFGQITRVRHTNCHKGALGGWFDSDYRWMANPEISGCGAFGDLGTHSLDILMWFFGRPESVTADIRSVIERYGADCDETGTALMKFPKGIIATLAGGWVDLVNPVSCEISGTEGFAYVLDGKLYVNSPNLPGADGSEYQDQESPLPHAFMLFLDALNGKEAPLVGADEAADRNIVMEALYSSAQRQEWLSPAY